MSVKVTFGCLLLALALAPAGCSPELPQRTWRTPPGAGRDGSVMTLLEAGVPASPSPGQRRDTGPRADAMTSPPAPPGPPAPPAPPSGPSCGNGLIEAGEICDGNAAACTSLDATKFESGSAPCNSQCSGHELAGCTLIQIKIKISDAISGTITKAQLEQDLTLISGDAFNGRYPASSGDKQMRSHAASVFKAAGLAPAMAGYEQPFTWNGKATANVVGVLSGTDPALKDEVVIVGAHHDHLGTSSDYGCSKQGGNSVCNGADDNGTGTVTVLALARALGKMKGQNRRTLVFMLFGAEEKGLKGSKYYVDNPIYSLSKTVYMINVDMIGDSSGSVSALGAGRSSLATGWIKSAASTYGVTAKITNSAGGGSDHYHFALAKVPYVFFHTGISACYHSTCDTAEKIRFEEMTKIARTVARVMWHASQANQSPRSDFVSYTLPAPVDLGDWKKFTAHLDHAL